MSVQSSWTDTYIVRSYEVDVNHTIQLPVLCNFFQESAWHHAENIGYGYFTISERNSMWVLTKLVMEIVRLPAWDETVTIETWPKGTERLFALRDFSVCDSSGNEIVAATSFWLLLEADTKRPRRLERYKKDVPFTPDRHAVREKYSKTERLNAPAENYRKRVRYSELDQNKHVNNVHYIRWLLDAYEPEFFTRFIPKRFEVHYLGEALYNDEIEILSGKSDVKGGPNGAPEKGGIGYAHEVQRPHDEAVLCRGAVEWRPQV